jgi:hypothetical protein
MRCIKILVVLVVTVFLIGTLATTNASAELVTAYTFEPPTELKDVAVILGGGGVATDDLTCSGSCTSTGGVFGQAIEVGLADYLVTLGSSSDLNPGPNGFTIAFYTYGIDVQTASQIVSKYSPNDGWYCASVLDVGLEEIRGGFVGGGTFNDHLVTDEGTVQGAWRHIALTFDGVNTSSIYIDGQHKLTRNDVIFLPSDIPVYFGVASHDPGAFWHQYWGIFDDVAIFDESLSAEDIRRLSEEGIEEYMGYGPGKGKGHAYGKLKKYQVRLPKTGQTTLYATGDDGDLQKGVECPEPRFTDNEDGTVTDKCTGLVWLKDANCFGQQTWANALISSNALANGPCGVSDGSLAGDWRLPNIRELHSLIDYGNIEPALPSGHPFTGVQVSPNPVTLYWSSTTFPPATHAAYTVDMNYGSVGAFSKNSVPYYVWPVRGGN